MNYIIKILSVFLTIFLVCFIIYVYINKFSSNSNEKNNYLETKQEQLGTFNHENYIGFLPKYSFPGISENEVTKLCFEILGGKNKENGFDISYYCLGAIKHNDVYYYIVNVSWLVDEQHWSTINKLMVSANGDEIYQAIEKEGEYSLGDKIWFRT